MAVANSTRNPISVTARMMAVATPNRISRRNCQRIPTVTATLPRIATVTVCIAATSVPNRELITPVARNSWKVSAGRSNRSSRKGTALFRLPKNESSPAPNSCG